MGYGRFEERMDGMCSYKHTHNSAVQCNLHASTGRLRVFKQGGGAGQLGVQQSITATSGYVYDFTITIENTFTSNSTVVLEIIDPNNTVIYTPNLGV